MLGGIVVLGFRPPRVCGPRPAAGEGPGRIGGRTAGQAKHNQARLRRAAAQPNGAAGRSRTVLSFKYFMMKVGRGF